MIINSNNTNTNTTSARRRASRASSPAAAAAALFLLACIAPAPCDAQSVVQQVRRAFSSAGGRTLTQDDPAARGFKRPSYREKYKPKPTPKPTPNKCSGNVIKCKEDTTCEKKFPCFNSFCDFGDGHRGKDSWKRTNWKYKPDKPRHGVCACEDKKKNNHECIVPGGGAKCTGPFGKCSYEGQCVPDDRDDGCPCDGNVADAGACGLDPLTPCVDPSQPCKCNGTGSCVPNYIDGLACPKTDSMGVCDSPTTGKCNAAGVCESVSVPGLACDPDDTPNLCISNTSGTCDDTGRFCTADVLEDGCPCTPADYTTVDKTVDCNGDGNTVSTECLDKTNPCNCELHDGITCVPNYIDGLACDSPATPGVCDSPTTGKCNADGVCESVSVPGLACDPENTPNLCISNTSGTCDDTGLLCTADFLDEGCPCTPPVYDPDGDGDITCGEIDVVRSPCLDRNTPCKCNGTSGCVPNFFVGAVCPPPEATGDEQCKVHACQADGSCETDNLTDLSEGSPCLSCVVADDEDADCVGNPPCKCNADGMCIPNFIQGLACNADVEGEPLDCDNAGLCTAEGMCEDGNCTNGVDPCDGKDPNARCQLLGGDGFCCGEMGSLTCCPTQCCGLASACCPSTEVCCKGTPDMIRAHDERQCRMPSDCAPPDCPPSTGVKCGNICCALTDSCCGTSRDQCCNCLGDNVCTQSCGSGNADCDKACVNAIEDGACVAGGRGSTKCKCRATGGTASQCPGFPNPGYKCCECKEGNTRSFDGFLGAIDELNTASRGAVPTKLSSAPRPSTDNSSGSRAGSGTLDSTTAARTESGDAQQVAQRPATATARAASSAGVYDASTQQQQRPRPREP